MSKLSLFLVCVAILLAKICGEDENGDPTTLSPHRVPSLRVPAVARPECRSQLEQLQFWKTFSLYPSENLTKSIREYEVFHAKCRSYEKDGNLKRYFDKEIKLPCKYSIWIATWDGIGNRLLSLVSTLIHAMLTRRVLLVDRRWDIENFLCEPFPWSSWRIPENIDTELWQKNLKRVGDYTSESWRKRVRREEFWKGFQEVAGRKEEWERSQRQFVGGEEGAERTIDVMGFDVLKERYGDLNREDFGNIKEEVERTMEEFQKRFSRLEFEYGDKDGFADLRVGFDSIRLGLQEVSNDFAKIEEQFEEFEVPYAIIADINHATPSDMTFFCDSEMDDIEKIPVLLLRSNMYFIVGDYFTFHRQTLESWFPDRRVFTHVARYLLSPVNSLWDIMMDYYSANLSNATKLLGVQMRMFEHPWRREKSHRLVDCAQQHGFLPMKVEGEGEAEGGGAGERTACLVASLHKEFYEHLIDTFNTGSTVDGHLVTVHRASHADQQLSGESSHNIEVMLEIWLLSFSDYLIASPGSTFGYVASGLRGKDLLFLNGLFHNTDETFSDKACSESAGEPCWSKPPFQVKCFTDPPFDNPWQRAPGVVERCFDYPRGARIVVPRAEGERERERETRR